MRNGKHTIHQAIHTAGGRNPSMMCIAWAGDAIRIIDAKTASIVKHFSDINSLLLI